jgi:outer membrane immunogenic protein
MTCANTTSARTERRCRARGGLYLAVGVAMLATLDVSRAADYDDSFLRGAFAPTAPYNRWDGAYVGADLGRSQVAADFKGGVSQLVAYILRNSTLENEGRVSEWSNVPNGRGTGNQFGGFAGYNWQMDDLVLGVEGAYHRATSPITAKGVDTLARRFTTSDGYDNSVNLRTSGRFALRDYATMRGRAGYAFGQFMPYAGVGFTVARVAYGTGATVRVTAPAQGGNPPINFGPVTKTDGKDNAIAYGANLALGVDITLLPNMFLRGEWEYIAFAAINGNRANVNTFRAGLGLKF